MRVRVGLLVDLNSFPTFGKDECYVNDENSPIPDNGENSSYGGSSVDLCPLDSRLQDKIHKLQEFILEHMTQHGTIRQKFDVSDYEFGYRFFNSSSAFTPLREAGGFRSFTPQAFTEFEKSMEAEMRNALLNNMLNPNEYGISHVSAGFKTIVSSLGWKNDKAFTTSSQSYQSSQSKNSSGNSELGTDSLSPFETPEESVRNSIFVFFRVPRNEDELVSLLCNSDTYLEHSITSSKAFLTSLVTQNFAKTIKSEFKIQVNFVDMWHLEKNVMNSETELIYPTVITKVLRHFHNGQVIRPEWKISLGPNFPSWKTLLINNLKAMTFQSSEYSVLSHVSYSSCSTPTLTNTSQSNGKIQEILKQAMAGNSNRKLDIASGEFNRSASLSLPSDSLQQSALFNSRSQSQIYSSASSQARSRALPRFGSGTQTQSILLNNSFNPLSSISQRTLDLLGITKGLINKRKLSKSGGSKPVPVRRNLFNSENGCSESIQQLLRSAAIFRRNRSPTIQRSPVIPSSPADPSSPGWSEFKFPRSNSVLKSKRRLDMGDGSSLSISPGSSCRSPYGSFGSPVHALSGVICPGTPEFPVTPPSKRIRAVYGILSTDKRDFVEGSPENSEAESSDNGRKPFTRHDSFSFYSTSTGDAKVGKSRAWEESGRKLQAARIRESVDLSRIAASSLSLDDLELINPDPNDSPLPKTNRTPSPSSPIT